MTFTPELEQAARAMYATSPQMGFFYETKSIEPIQFDDLPERDRALLINAARACWLSALPVSEAVVKESCLKASGSTCFYDAHDLPFLGRFLTAAIHAIVGKEACDG